MQFESFWGSANFTELGAVAASAAGKALELDAGGGGTLVPGDVDSSDRGKREDGDGDETLALVGPNVNDLPMTADFESRTCSLQGNLAGSVSAGAHRCAANAVATQVRDTAAPTVLCNTTATITPPDAQHPATFTATATDVCDASVVPTLSNATCWYDTKSGKKAYRDQCVVAFAGPTVSISNSGGVGDYISWDASASDDSGNAASTTCTVKVVRQ